MAEQTLKTTPSTKLVQPALPASTSASKANVRTPQMSTPARASTPELTAEMGNLSFRADSPDDTPTGDRGVKLPKDLGLTTENQATAESLVINLKPIHEDDVFGSSPDLPRASSVPDLSCKAAEGDEKKITTIATLHNYGYTPRPDRDVSNITAANMQAVFRPDALIFVANLPNHKTEFHLDYECKKHFNTFGECFVKIKRDKNQQPFALIQYKDVEAAEAAIEGSKFVYMDGREIRAEKARGNCSVIVMRPGRSLVTDAEARAVLKNYGEITEIKQIFMPNGGQGTEVKFAYWQDARDALKNFRHNRDSNLFEIVEAEKADGYTQTRSLVRYAPRTARSTTDVKSIFVGDLPQWVTEQQVRDHFMRFGVIRNCNLIHKPWTGAGTNTMNCFAFVEYDDPQAAEDAAKQECFFGDKKVRVEPKEYSARRPQRLAEYAADTPPRSSPLNSMRHNTYMPPMQQSPVNFMSPGTSSYGRSPAGVQYGFSNTLISPFSSPMQAQPYNQYQTPPRATYQHLQSPFQHSPAAYSIYSPPHMGPYQQQYHTPPQVPHQQPVYYPAAFYNNAGMPAVHETEEEHEG